MYTVAGQGGVGGYGDGFALTATFSLPAAVCMVHYDRDGGDVEGRYFIIVADRTNHCIRCVDVSGAMVSTIAGGRRSGYRDDDALTSFFDFPTAVCIDPSNGSIIVSDGWNNRIRCIERDMMKNESDDASLLPFHSDVCRVRTLAGTGATGHVDGDALSSTFNYPTGICCMIHPIDHSIHSLFDGTASLSSSSSIHSLPYAIIISDSFNHSIRCLEYQNMSDEERHEVEGIYTI